MAPPVVAKSKEEPDWGSLDLPENPSVALRRLADQINFFNARSKECQNRYKLLKSGTIVFAALITVSGAFASPHWLAPVLGAAIVVFEGLIHLNSLVHNWLSYRNTCETLKHEKYLFLSRAGHYADAADSDRLLAERTEEILRSDRLAWIATQHDSQKKQRTLENSET